MKRSAASIVAFLLLITALSGCRQADMPENTGSDGKVSVVCTIFPLYDWVRQILADKTDSIDLILLLNNGADMHSYQPSVDDMVKILTCDLLIYVGGESDKWLEDALKNAENPDMIVINLLDALGDAAKKEDIVEGMEEEDRNGGEEPEPDEHVWLSLKNAVALCDAIADAFSSLDIGIAEDSLSVYTEKLKALDAQYQEAVNGGSTKTVLFGDRFPFRYLVDDYGLDYHAAFPGCSAETEAGFDTIVFLAKKTDELGLGAIMVTESADQSIAKAIRNNTADKNQQILVLDSMQSVTESGIQNGATYLSIMESNLNVLKEALK